MAIELKSPELGRWIPYTRINHKRDYITSKLAIYYEDDVPVRVLKCLASICSLQSL